MKPPAPYNAFESFAGDANGRTFVFAAHWDIFGKNGTDFYQRSQRAPLKFMVLRITADGRATGLMRQWVSPPPAATPVLTGLGAWTSDGRTLAIGQMTIQPDGTIPSTPTTMYMLDTATLGSSLPTSRAVTPPRNSYDFRAFITPDGNKLISEIRSGPVRLSGTTESGTLGVYSARTVALLRVVGRWQLHGHGLAFNRVRQMVVWSSPSGGSLIVEMPRGKLAEVGILKGNKFTPLPHVAQAPLLNAINNGGFQTNGGYVGFAW